MGTRNDTPPTVGVEDGSTRTLFVANLVVVRRDRTNSRASSCTQMKRALKVKHELNELIGTTIPGVVGCAKPISWFGVRRIAEVVLLWQTKGTLTWN